MKDGEANTGRIYVMVRLAVPVTPGRDGWENCASTTECAALAQRMYDENEVSVAEMMDWTDDDVTVSVVTDLSSLPETALLRNS